MSAREDFETCFKSASCRTSAFEAWQRLVYMAAYEIASALFLDTSGFAYIAKASRAAAEPEMDAYRGCFDALVRALGEDPYQDFMGSEFMRLGIGNEAGGQFFTPFHISELMGRIAVEAEGRTVSVLEPSCGAGANCIAVCKACAEAGVDWQRRVFFDCQDISELTALTCYVQLSLIGAAAEVSVGDTLRMERRYSLKTPVLMVEPCWALEAMRRGK